MERSIFEHVEANPAGDVAKRKITKEAAKSEKTDLKLQYGNRFREAVADSQYMMIYAATNCPNAIQQATVEQLITARQLVETDTPLSPQQEAQFWISYQDLWKVVQPVTRKDLSVTAESIKANIPLKKTFLGWLFGFAFSTEDWTISRSRKMVNRYILFTSLVLAFLLFCQVYWAIGNQLFTQMNDLSKAVEDLNAQQSQNPQIDIQKNLASLNTQLQPYYSMVRDWDYPWERLARIIGLQLTSQEKYNLAGKFALDILQSYLLPLLYGILGASIYVLRSLSRHIGNVTYSQVPGIRHVVHIALGALAGILVGWFSFLIPSDSVIGTVSPLAIAFLVGYNIELVFTKMDEVILTRVAQIRERTLSNLQEDPQAAASQTGVIVPRE